VPIKFLYALGLTLSTMQMIYDTTEDNLEKAPNPLVLRKILPKKAGKKGKPLLGEA